MGDRGENAIDFLLEVCYNGRIWVCVTRGILPCMQTEVFIKNPVNMITFGP